MQKKGTGLAIYALISGISILMVLIIIAFYLSGGISLQSKGSGETHFACVENACRIVEGPGLDQCEARGSFCGCLDTDKSDDFPKGLDHKKQGTVRNLDESKTDICSSSGFLLEYHCQEDDSIAYTEIRCNTLGDYSCFAGECVLNTEHISRCVDSDGGPEYEIDGYATDGENKIEDYCTSEGRLGEAICSPDRQDVFIDLFDCKELGDYKCENGKCIPS